ncbi:MAG: hypothetical protein PHD60_04985 [Clostridia bacterium]|nr:hypothetical protein [Clostridia bacterium]
MNKGIVIFIEGDTEVEFYKKLLENIRSLCDDKMFHLSKIFTKNLKGIGNYKNRAYRVFTNDIVQNNPGISFKAFLCYDTDVFEFSQKPPVKWKDVEKILLDNGAEKVIHIKAKKSIEDWFLRDHLGLCKYLRLPTTTTYSGLNSVKKMETLFKKANKVYIKGGKTNGLIESLDIKKIMKEICCEIKPLCKELGVKCVGELCKSNDRSKSVN